MLSFAPRKELIMDTLGINYTFLAFQILNFALIISHIVLALIALRRLWQGDFSDGQRWLWTLLILLIPLLGSVGFLFAIRHTSANTMI
jgi:hypothetical protein